MKMDAIEQLRFLKDRDVRELADTYGFPLFVYDEKSLRSRAEEMLNFKAPFGLTVRYAMKANPNVNILKFFHSLGLHIDASSGYEVERALRAGIPASHILLTAQELAFNLEAIVNQGVNFNATNLRQLEAFGKLFPGREVGVRINPGLGSGGTNRTNTGGPASSFGIWHECISDIKSITAKYQLQITRVHTHIGSGSDPEVWTKVSRMSINLLDHFPEASTLSLGGGYKVGRMSYEPSADIQKISASVHDLIEDYAEKTKRKIHLEIEPGTYLVANGASLISKVDSISHTGTEGYRFYVITSGLTEVTRPALYGAQHPLIVVPQRETEDVEHEEVIVAGHCCESGDILTPQPGDPEALKPRILRKARVGDYLVIDSVGAYCSGMSLKNYNSFPEAAEVWLDSRGVPALMRRRQTLDQILANEIPLF